MFPRLLKAQERFLLIAVPKFVPIQARFENASDPETIEPDLIQSTSFQSFTEGSEAGEEPK